MPTLAAALLSPAIPDGVPSPVELQQSGDAGSTSQRLHVQSDQLIGQMAQRVAASKEDVRLATPSPRCPNHLVDPLPALLFRPLNVTRDDRATKSTARGNPRNKTAAPLRTQVVKLLCTMVTTVK